MTFALDASVTITWAMADEIAPLTTRTYEQLETDDALVPSLWWFEVRNALIINERRKRLREAETTAFLNELKRFSIITDTSPDERDVLALARRHKLTVYDAAYLELVLRHDIPLATFDDALRRACKAAGGSLL